MFHLVTMLPSYVSDNFIFIILANVQPYETQKGSILTGRNIQKSQLDAFESVW